MLPLITACPITKGEHRGGNQAVCKCYHDEIFGEYRINAEVVGVLPKSQTPTERAGYFMILRGGAVLAYGTVRILANWCMNMFSMILKISQTDFPDI